MNRISLKRNKMKIILMLSSLFLISAAFSIYLFLQPSTLKNQRNDTTSLIKTSYDYKATITPNILYPNGGTIEVGEIIFKKITTAIPFDLKSTLYSEEQVSVTGTHEVQLIVKAGDIWERAFPLEQEQAFEQKGTEISLINNAFIIDLEEIQSFIRQVEEETEIRPAQYTLEVVPQLQGTIHYAGEERNFQVQDKLIFQYSHEEVLLAGEKTFSATISFSTAEVLINNFKLMGVVLPLNHVRMISTLFSLFLLTTIILAYKYVGRNPNTSITTQTEIINRKFGKRIIPVSQKINITQKSILILDSFESVIKIADEKELPILFYKDYQNKSGVYFIVDGDYLYSFEVGQTNLGANPKKGAGSDKAYAGS